MPRPYNGQDTQIYYWYPGRSAGRRLLPLNITGITYGGVTRSVLETTHLLTKASDEGNEFGGRTYEPGMLDDPGELSISCFTDPNVLAPKGKFLTQILFPQLRGFNGRVRWLGYGFFTLYGGFTVAVDENIVTTMTLKLSGNMTITRIHRRGYVPPAE